MIRFPKTQRKLYVHAAHRTIGVSGGGVALPPYCRIDDISAGDDIAAPPLRIALVADGKQHDDVAARKAFEQAAIHRGDWQCFLVDSRNNAPALNHHLNVDCIVLFHQGLHIARQWSDMNGNSRTAVNAERRELNETESIRGEIVPLESHPILEGVKPFEADLESFRDVSTPNDATFLLLGKSENDTYPVAWLTHVDGGHVFHTVLGSPEDYCRAVFRKLLLNAIEWICRREG